MVTQPYLDEMDRLLQQAVGFWPGLRARTDSYDQTQVRPWLTSAMHVVALAFGKQSVFYEQMRDEPGFKHLDGSRHYHPHQVAGLIGILEQAKGALERGLVTSIQEAAVAATFDDLADVAEHLHNQGFHLAAVAVAGAVLEGELRNLYQKTVGPWRGRDVPSISKLNDAVYAKGKSGRLPQYDKTEHKHVTAWGGLRNDADHGNVSNSSELPIIGADGKPKRPIDVAKVRDMISGVRSFVNRYKSIP